MVGNDLVDLRDRETQPTSRHPRFDSRVFTAAEGRLIRTSRDSNRVRWMLWACKESAFKLVKRQNPTVAFSPRAFEVTMVFPDLAYVTHQERIVCVEIDWRRGDTIHAIATWNRMDATRLISAVGETTSNPSKAVRDLARRRLAWALSCNPSEIVIASGPDRVPKLRIGGNSSRGFMSLSHHGRFVAFSCWLIPPPISR